MKKSIFTFVAIITLICIESFAQKIPDLGGVRPFGSVSRSDMYFLIGKTSIQSSNLNTFLKSQNLLEPESLTSYTFEFSGQSLLSTLTSTPLLFGSRFNYSETHSKTTQATSSDSAYLRAATWNLILRPYVYDGENSKLSFFGGLGPSWSELTVNQAAGVSKFDLAPWTFDWSGIAGITYVLGAPNFGIAIEAGYSWNQFRTLRELAKFTTNAPGEFELSGLFLNIGFSANFGPRISKSNID